MSEQTIQQSYQTPKDYGEIDAKEAAEEVSAKTRSEMNTLLIGIIGIFLTLLLGKLNDWYGNIAAGATIVLFVVKYAKLKNYKSYLEEKYDVKSKSWMPKFKKTDTE